MGEEWRNLDEDEKRPYEDKAKAAREKYDRDMAAYREGKVVEQDEEDYSEED